MKVWSMIPLLRYEQGHPYQYNLVFGEACQINGWEHGALVPVSCLIEDLPETWKKVLPEDFFTDKGCSIIWKTPVQKLKTMLLGIIPLCKVLKSLSKSGECPIIFLEQFFLGQFLTWFFATLLTRPNIEFWVLHRYSPSNMPLKGRIYRILQNFLYLWLGKDKLKLLTDSSLLAKEQQAFFKRAITVLPIPHTDDWEAAPFAKEDTKKTLWWPGGYTLPTKGLKHIQRVVKLSKADDWKLLVAESARKNLSEATMFVHYIPSHLSRLDYMRWMKTVDLVLLPYDPVVYGSATSGIFVEAVVCGTPPVTIAGTWMASELKRYQLDELILDWNSATLLEDFERILKSKTIYQKLSKMREEYQAFHSLEGFAKSLKKVSTS